MDNTQLTKQEILDTLREFMQESKTPRELIKDFMLVALEGSLSIDSMVGTRDNLTRDIKRTISRSYKQTFDVVSNMKPKESSAPVVNSRYRNEYIAGKTITEKKPITPQPTTPVVELKTGAPKTKVDIKIPKKPNEKIETKESSTIDTIPSPAKLITMTDEELMGALGGKKGIQSYAKGKGINLASNLTPVKFLTKFRSEIKKQLDEAASLVG